MLSAPSVDAKNYPLTYKWFTLIRKFAYKHNKHLPDLIQESYLIEWYMLKRKFKSVKHKQNYFVKSLYQHLYRRVNDWGFMESPDKNYRVYSNMPKDTDTLDFRENTPKKYKVCFSDSDIPDVTDSIIQLRPFNEIYYTELVQRVVLLLSAKDLLAAKLFTDRMKLQLQWKEIRLQKYRTVPHNRFYKAVKLIKTIVTQNVSGCSTSVNFAKSSRLKYEFSY